MKIKWTFFLAIFESNQCYNVDVASVKLSNKQSPGAFFGYSVSSYNYGLGKSKIFVGAPFRISDEVKMGSVYLCDFETTNCEELNLLNRSHNPWDENHNGLLGASVTHDIHGEILLCQPRYGRKYHCENKKLCDRPKLFTEDDKIENEIFGGIKRDGRCFYLNYDGEKLQNVNEWNVCFKRKRILYENCVSGLKGALFAEDFSILSTIGIRNGQGSLGILNRTMIENGNIMENREVQKNLDMVDPASKFANEIYQECLKNHKNPRDCIDLKLRLNAYQSAAFDQSHLGSSIKYLKKSSIILSGSPNRRRDTLTGHVVAFGVENNLWTNDMNELWNFTSSSFIDGAQMGEQFGHEIVTGDFNNDGFEDFAVSAPTWTNLKSYPMKVNVGRVYIFIANEANKFMSKESFEPSQILEGLEINGQFGFAMESVDINQDDFDDLIISAPFVENGKIYIFNGKPSPDDVLEIFDQIPSQTISQFESNWFGHSLSVNADLDDNQYSDIVVGSPKSEEVFIFKTRPSVQLEIIVNLPEKALKFQDSAKEFQCSEKSRASGYINCIQWQACGKYSGKSLSNETKGKISVELDTGILSKRLFFVDTNGGLQSFIELDLQMTKKKKNCLPFMELVVKTGKKGEFSMNRVQPIIIRSVLDVITPDEVLSPIPNPYSNRVDESQINLWRNCGNDNICDSNLAVSVNYKIESKIERNYFLVDSNNVISIISALTVEPELSYGTRMYLQIPLEATLISTTVNGAGIPGLCLSVTKDNFQILNCPIGNPLNSGTHNVVSKIKLTPNGKQKADDIQLLFNNTNTHVSTTETKKFNFENKIFSDFSCFVTANPENIRYDSRTENLDLSINQKFTVTNNGPAKVRNSAIIVKFPRYTRGGKELLTDIKKPWAIYSADNSTVKCTKLVSDGYYNLNPEDDYDITKTLTNNERKYSCNEAASCITIKCNLRGRIFEPKSSYTIELKSTVFQNTIEEFRNNSIFITEFQFIVDKNGYRYDFDAKEQIHLQRVSQVRLTISSSDENEIPLWIIIVAASGAILLLLIITLICLKCGIFKNADEHEIMTHTAEKRRTERPQYHQAHIEES